VVKPKFFTRRIKKASEILPKAKTKEMIKDSFTFPKPHPPNQAIDENQR